MTLITNEWFCFPIFSFIVFWVLSLSVLLVTPVRPESMSFLHEIETLEDEIFALIKTNAEGDALYDALINGTCPTNLRGNNNKNYRCLEMNGGCYCIVTEHTNWWNALHLCRQYGMELLSLETKEEEENLAKRLKSIAAIDDPKTKRRFYLTSGNRIYGNRTTWMWAGTGDILPLETRELIWQNGEPSQTHGNVQEECLIWVLTLNETLLINEWNDLSCTGGFNFEFVCELQTSTSFL